MTGVELAAAARRLRPDLPVVLASGYVDVATVRTSALEATMIRKPYGLDDVSTALRRAIGEREAAAAASRRQVRS